VIWFRGEQASFVSLDVPIIRRNPPLGRVE